MIKLAAVEDHRLLIDGLRAWAETVPDIEIAVVAATVDAFLLDSPGPYDVVLLNPWLRADPDPAANVRRLTDAGQRVLLVDGSADLSMVAASLAAGAHGYLTRDHDAAALARTVRESPPARPHGHWVRLRLREPGGRVGRRCPNANMAS